MFDKNMRIEGFDDEIFSAIAQEERRQEEHIELIASENYASPRVLQAQGTVLTNKYAEGYPGKRYYGGCEYVDKAETLAIERARALFGAAYANVQPHSGSQANSAVFQALCAPGDTVLGMSLADGGHLTHGSPVNASGLLYNFVSYGTGAEDRIDMDEVRALALEHRPKMIVAGTTAYPRRLDPEPFKKIADEVGALLLFDIAHLAGLVAGGAHPNPVPYCEVVTSTTHKTLTGPRAGIIMCRREYAEAIDRAVFPGMQGGPLMHVIAAKAVCLRIAQSDEFRKLQRQIVKNCAVLAETLAEGGLRLVSGGTDVHLALVDLRPAGLTGLECQDLLERVNITANRNVVPFEDASFNVASGLRGTGGRLGLLLGHAGNRSDADIERLANVAAAARPDLVVVKELEGYLRGRAPGEVPAVIRAALLRSGLPESALPLRSSEVDAARCALDWARPGDVLLLLVHSLAARTAVVTMLEAAR